jgi:hypothetical protein
VVPWAEGGATRLDNLVLLCRHHHRRVHEEGWRLELVEGESTAGGRPTVRVHRPDGSELPAVPDRPEVPEAPAAELKRRQRELGIDARTATPDGVAPALDVDFALYALMPPLEANRASPGADGGPDENGGSADAGSGDGPSPGGNRDDGREDGRAENADGNVSAET